MKKKSLNRRRAAWAPEATGFQAAFQECFGPVLPCLPKRCGRHPRVALAKVLPALLFHFMSAAGTLAQHFAQLFDDGLCDSSLSERRRRLPWEVFTELMRLGLRPLAQAATHPDAFWRDWRLVALDGTQFSLTNTPPIKAATRKAKTRRGRAAFAKITTGVLLELGLHNPLAAAIGRGGQSEWVLALELVAQLPAQALRQADRLHGCAAFLAAAQAACQKVGSHFLICARSNLRVKTVKRFKDGSRLVRLPVRKQGQPRVVEQWLELREIRVRVQRPGHRARELRLWTSLLEPKEAPAQELIELYARRWEHELYYRELKRPLRKNEVLQSHTSSSSSTPEFPKGIRASLDISQRNRSADFPVGGIADFPTRDAFAGATVGRLGNRRYRRLGNLRYRAFALLLPNECEISGLGRRSGQGACAIGAALCSRNSRPHPCCRCLCISPLADRETAGACG